MITMLVLCLFLCSCGNENKISEDVCAECNGKLKIPCKECNGSGETDCTEENCDNGIIGVSCTNCGGREGIEVCTRCDGEGTEIGDCEICGGDGIIRNPITWEDFYCKNCNAKGTVIKACSRCGGHGLICNYCRANLSTYPHPDYYPHYVYCETCNGNGKIKCEVCLGKKEIPCSICASSEYEEYRLEREKILASKETLPSLEGKWEFVSGNEKFFLPNMTDIPDYYEFVETENMLQIYSVVSDSKLTGYHYVKIIDAELVCYSTYFESVEYNIELNDNTIRIDSSDGDYIILTKENP